MLPMDGASSNIVQEMLLPERNELPSWLSQYVTRFFVQHVKFSVEALRTQRAYSPGQTGSV